MQWLVVLNVLGVTSESVPQGSCYDPANGIVVTTGPPGCCRTRWSPGCGRSKPGVCVCVCPFVMGQRVVAVCFLCHWAVLTKLPLLHPQYKQNPEMFKQTARLWSHIYAGAPITSPDYTRKIDKLCAMGFDKVRTLLEVFWNSNVWLCQWGRCLEF